MTPPPSMKVRLVQCPRCRQVLAELPGISLYRCGGCEIILQAKHRNMEENHAVTSVAKIQEDSFPEEEEARSSNLDFPSPPKEDSSPDKDNMEFQDDGVESSSDLSEYGSAYNGLCSSSEFNLDMGECSLQKDSEIYDNKLHDSDEDSTGGGNFTDEIPSSTKANEWVEEHDNMYFDRTTKVDQTNGEQSPRVWRGEKFMDEVGIFYRCEDHESRLQHVDTEYREGIDNSYADLEHDTVSENEATRLNQDLTILPKEESFSDKVSRNVSNGLLRIPDIDHCQYEDPRAEVSVNHDRVKSCLGLDSKRFGELHVSDGESTAGGNFSGEIPSCCELVYQGIDELATEAKQVGEDGKFYFDQPTNRDQCDDVEFSDHEDHENGWIPVSAEHDVSQEEAMNLNHGLGRQRTSDKYNIRYHDEHVESSTEQSEDRSIFSGLLSSPEVEYCENKDIVESLVHDDSQDSERVDSGLLILCEDEEILLDGPKKVGRFEGGESLGVCQTSDNFMHKVQNISVLEAQENGLSSVSTEHIEVITNNHVLLENDDVSIDVAKINEHEEGINSIYVHHENDDVSKEVIGNHVHLEKNDVLKEVAIINEHEEGNDNIHAHLENSDVSEEVVRNHVYLENDDVSKEVARSLNHDLISQPKEESSLDKAYMQLQDEHVESRIEFSVVRVVSNDLSSLPQFNCCQNEDPLMEKSLSKDQGRISLAPDFKRHDRKLHDLDGESIGGGDISGEIHSSIELVNHETEELIPEATEHTNECNKSYLDQPTKVDQFEGDKYLQVPPDDDSILHEVQDFSGHEETRHTSMCSAAEIVSHEVGNASHIDDGFKGSPTFKRASTNDPSFGDTIAASQVVFVGVPANLTSLDGKHVDHSPRKGSRNFTSASSVEFLEDSLFSETSPELVKPKDTTSYATTRGYYAYDGSESLNDETDGQIPVYVPHSSRRKGKEVDYSSTTLKKEGFVAKNTPINEPEMKDLEPSLTNQHHAISGSHGTLDELTETKSRSLASRRILRLNEVGSSWLPFTSRNQQANQRLKSQPVFRNNLPPLHPGYHSPDKTSFSEPDKMDLLRTVCELKDQLNKIQLPQISRDERFPAGVMREKFSPSLSYYDHLMPRREAFTILNHHGNYQWHDQHKGRIGQSNVSALALSGEAARYWHQVNCSCLHCRTRYWRSSAPLLPHFSHYNGRTVVHTGHNSRDISSPSSPRNYSSQEFPVRHHETTPDNQRRIDTEMRRLYLRGKHNASKQHVRPLAGGSPFVTCYRCSKTLQLPADFLVFKKRYHRLRCNACSKVLKFSLLGGKHIVPYLPGRLEAGDFSDATKERSLLLMPHSSFCQHGEPASSSDDYGRSFGGSCSTEAEAPVVISSSGLVERNRYNRKLSPVSSYEAMEDRKMKPMMKNSIDKTKNKNKVEPFSEIDELPPLSNSSLHQLMGYSSVTQVLNKGPEMDRQR